MAFSADWLALREPADHAARDAGLLAQAGRTCAGATAVVADLGAGTGSTARAFGAGGAQGWFWRYIDADSALLEIAVNQLPGAQGIQMDLGQVEDLPLEGADLVTASALLDLMPEAWVSALAQRLARHAIPFYAALSYNGEMSWSPALEGDAAITAAFNAHQGRDKGLGPALGPNAASRCAEIFAEAGFEVRCADSPWTLTPDAGDLHRQLIEGIAAAAAEMRAPAAAEWLSARLACLTNSTATIGHTDLLAIPHRSH